VNVFTGIRLAEADVLLLSYTSLQPLASSVVERNNSSKRAAAEEQVVWTIHS
jgi:hypothetical protein